MKIVLLNTNPYITSWFQKVYPYVDVFKEANTELWEAELILFISEYRINGEVYDILNMWKKVIEIKADDKKIGIIGWLPSNFNNFIQIGNPPDHLISWAEKVRPVSQNPDYPTPNSINILKVLNKVFLSHGKNTIQSLLIEGVSMFLEIEDALEDKMQISSILKMDTFREASLVINRLEQLWSTQHAFLSLMPQYPELCMLNEFIMEWRSFEKDPQSYPLNLSERVEDYLEEVVTELTDFYDMEIFK